MSKKTDADDYAVTFSRFDAAKYARSYADIGDETALAHYLKVGIDEGRTPKLSRDSLELRGSVERFFVSESGYFAFLGWCADEGSGDLDAKIFGGDFTVKIANSAIFRHARTDIEVEVRPGAIDYGFVIIGSTPSSALLKQNVMLSLSSVVGVFQGKGEPDVVSDKRFLETLLIFLHKAQSHAGKECRLFHFLSGGAGRSLASVFDKLVATAGREIYRESFGRRKVSRSFVTVLFGSVEPVLLQPVLFRNAGIDFGEWIYICNSPDDGTALLRLAQLISNLYDLFITVIVLGDNVGFGAANNIAVSHASGSSIYIINPDVYPATMHVSNVIRTIGATSLGNHLWGGLLFYDEYNLMHSGMQLDCDRYFACKTGQRSSFPKDTASSVALLRVEHFDKGVPFEKAGWTGPRQVPTISGAVMAFDRDCFERIGGFSSRFIYGHYEDADLSIRWTEKNGKVLIDPDLRLVHLEGQGSKPRGEQFSAAAAVNRYFFSMKHNEAFEREPGRFTTSTAFEPDKRPPAERRSHT